MKFFCKAKEEHKNIQLFEQVAQLPDHWDEGLPEGHFLQRKSLAVGEQSNLQKVSVLYALLIVGRQKVAQAHFMVLHISTEHLNTTSTQGWKKYAWQFLHTVKHPKLLVSGHLYRHDVQSCVANAAEDYERYIIYKSLLDAAQKHTKADAVLLKDIPGYTTRYFHHFAPEYFLMRNDISMEMDIPESWASFQDYEKALKHKYAQRARKVRKAFEGVVIKEWTAAEVEEHRVEIYRLYLQVTARQSATLGFISEDYLPNLKAAHGHNLKVWGMYKDNQLVAFASAWVKGEEEFDMFYIGIDYRYNNELQLYFNILFFSLEQAILQRCKKLILGRTALEAKARLGCKPRYLSTLLYIRNPILRKLIESLQQNLHKAEGEWEQRHPLK